MKTCSVPGCKDRTSVRHRFPLNDPQRFKIWRQNIANPKFDSMTNAHIYKGMMVCRSHFISRFHVPGTKMLHRKAIPTENLPSPPVFTSIPEMTPIEIAELPAAECQPSEVVEGFPQDQTNSDQQNLPGRKIDHTYASTPKGNVSGQKTVDVVRLTCAVPGCQPKEARQFRFPNPRNGRQRFQKWLEIIKNPALKSLTPETIYENRRVCGRHFEQEYFCRPNKLKYSAVPTLFVADPDAAKNWDYSESTDCQPIRRYPSNLIVQCNDGSNVEDVDLAMTNPLDPSSKKPASKMPTDLRCRICLTQTENAIPLSHSTNIDGEDSRTLYEILNRCCKIKIAIDDNKPQTICIDCVEKARTAYEFSRVCENSETILQKELENGGEGDSNTILCFIDVREFEKIEELCNGLEKSATSPTKRAPGRQVKAIKKLPCATQKSKIYAKCEDSVDFKLRNVRTKEDLILSKECACAQRMDSASALESVKRTICVQCCRNFSRYSRFKLYTNVLIGRKRYRCVKCGARFASPRNLNCHLISHKDILTYDYETRSFLDFS